MAMFDNIKFPFLTHQQLNLDWILNEIKRVMGFFPEEGEAGTVLMKTEDGTAWEELAAVDININGVPEDTELTDTDKLIFYDVSSSANRKITAPNLLNSMMSNGTPLMDGTGSAGTSKKPARYDHRHPTDTSRAPASYFQNNALKIENGGTGATTADSARVNIGAIGSIISDIQSFLIPGNSAASIRSFTISVPDGYTFLCPGSWEAANYNLNVYGVLRKSSTEIGIYAENPLSSDIACQVDLIFYR